MIDLSSFNINALIDSDANQLNKFIIDNSEQLKFFFPVTLEMNSSLEKTQAYISIKNKEIEEKTNFTFAIRDKNNQQIVGLIIIKKIDWDKKQGEFAYCICSELEGKGVTSFAVKEMTKFSFEDLGLKTIQIIAHKTNLGSVKVAEKNGFVWQKTLQNEFTPTNGTPLDMELYELYNEKKMIYICNEKKLMTEKELHNYLIKNYPIENEKCEWKEFKSLKNSVAGNESKDIISYISAIANMQGGHLVIGVKNETLEIIGIQDLSVYSIENIRYRVNGNCTNLDIQHFKVEEFITSDTNKIVWIFHIPKHQFRLPVYAHKKTWQRIDDNLVEMTKSRLDAILTQIQTNEDWSKVIISEASIEDLDKIAIQKARLEFVKRNPKYSDEVDSWSDLDFLNKAKLIIKGKITRTALILLGKEESEHFLDSSVKIRWNLKTIDNQDKDFEIFSIPLLLTIDEVYKKIRNLKYRYLRQGTLFPDEVLRYEPFNIRESLNNAIAHQDYSKGARINVVEFEDDHLVFSNYGSFLPKSVEDVVLKDTPEEVYRNPFLVEAMKNLDMIETQGGGIRKIFNYQKQRFFPLPDYNFEDNKVKITITGKILDENFAKILIKNSNLGLDEIILLDKVQKHKEISETEFKHLKKLKCIEGRRPNIYLSYDIIESTNDESLKVEYLANRSFDDSYFKDMIFEYLKKSGKTKRDKIDNLIIPKLSTALSDEKKKNKVTNYLSALRIEGKIVNMPGYFWEIV